MSMRDYPTSGFVVKAIELKKLLPIAVQEVYEAAYKDGNWEQMSNLLVNLPTSVPVPEEIYLHNDESSSEDLENGEIYAIFTFDDLYIKSETEEHKKLRQANIIPQFANWSIYG